MAHSHCPGPGQGSGPGMVNGYATQWFPVPVPVPVYCEQYIVLHSNPSILVPVPVPVPVPGSVNEPLEALPCFTKNVNILTPFMGRAITFQMLILPTMVDNYWANQLNKYHAEQACQNKR